MNKYGDESFITFLRIGREDADMDIKKGEIITEDNVRIIRPGHGLKPQFYPEILGQIAMRDIKRGTPLNLKMIGAY